MDVPIAHDADDGARAPGTARPGRSRSWRRRPAGDAPREPVPAWTIVVGLGLLLVAGIIGWRAWHAPRPPAPFPLRVVDEAGRPVEGAMVTLAASRDAHGPVERSDAEGRVVFGRPHLDVDRWDFADDGVAFATLLPVVPSFGAARVGGRWYRIDRDVPVRRGDVLRVAPVPVATLEAHLDTEDGPLVLVDFRRTADDLDAPTIPGDDDGVVRVPVVGDDVRGVLVTPNPLNRCTSAPLTLAPSATGPRRVVVRSDEALQRLGLVSAGGTPRPLTRRDVSAPDVEQPERSRPAAPLYFRASCFRPGGEFWLDAAPSIIDGGLGFAAGPGHWQILLRLEGEGWAWLDTEAPLPAVVRLRRTETRVALVGFDAIEATASRRSGVGPVRGRRDGETLVFDDLTPGDWDVTATLRGNARTGTATLTIDDDGRPRRTPVLSLR